MVEKLATTVTRRTTLDDSYLTHASPESMAAYAADWAQAYRRIGRQMAELHRHRLAALAGHRITRPAGHIVGELERDLLLSRSLTPRDTAWVEDPVTGIVVTGTVGMCFRCGEPTRRIDLSFGAPLCVPCFDPAWAEFAEAQAGT